MKEITLLLGQLQKTVLSNESSVQRFFVPLFLKALGYSSAHIRNEEGKQFEYIVGRRIVAAGIPDFIVHTKKGPAFVVEAKTSKKHLTSQDIGQLLSYANHPEIHTSLAVLTNGHVTQIYDVAKRRCLLEVKKPHLAEHSRELQLLLGKRALESQFGPVQLLAKLGSGSFGTVYKAWNPTVRRFEALKVYRPGIAEKQSKRISQGLKAQQQLRHESIAEVFAVHQINSEFGVAMYFANGMSLDRWLGKWSPTVRERLEVFVQVARAADYAHERGVVHRDLKPSNIIVEGTRKKWRPILIDFDTAVVTGSTFVTKTKDQIGSAGFMDPALMAGGKSSGRSRQVLSDIYSLGAILHYLLCLRPPGRMDYRQLEQDLSQVRGLTSRQASILPYILQQSLMEQPDSRYHDAGTLASDVERCIHSKLGESFSEKRFVREVFQHFDTLVRHHPLLRLFRQDVGRPDEVGRFGRIRFARIGEFDLAAIYDFGYRLFMTGHMYEEDRQLRRFMKSPAFRTLQRKYRTRLRYDFATPIEDAGVCIAIPIHEAAKQTPEAFAAELKCHLEMFIRVSGIKGAQLRATD